MRSSLYWDDFEKRTHEVVHAIKNNTTPPIRRVAVFITNKCNFKCQYCNHSIMGQTLSEEKFIDVINKYGDSAIIHITGGEPSVVPWLYPFIKENGDKYRFHLNTNAYIIPPYKYVKRLKVSLDHYDATYWDCLVGRNGAFKTVVDNIKKSLDHTTVSITYTLTKENYLDAVNFVNFANREFKGLYAIFFSVYKGSNKKYEMDNDDANYFFNNVLPELKKVLRKESLSLLMETIDEKIRLMKGVRFPDQIKNNICYLSMSERVISPSGEKFTCSHLYRDGIYRTSASKHEKCLYGCNQRLVRFNQMVEGLLK